jgi:hypothetical protein
MYELSRVRLHSIGPKGARYQDVSVAAQRQNQPRQLRHEIVVAAGVMQFRNRGHARRQVRRHITRRLCDAQR